MDSIYDNVGVGVSTAPIVVTATTNGSAVDTQGYQNAMVVIVAGVIDTASGNETYAYTVEESDDGSTGWAAISGATASVTASASQKFIRITNLNTTRKRYLRGVLTAGGTTPSIAHSIVILLGDPISGAVRA